MPGYMLYSQYQIERTLKLILKERKHGIRLLQNFNSEAEH